MRESKQSRKPNGIYICNCVHLGCLIHYTCLYLYLSHQHVSLLLPPPTVPSPTQCRRLPQMQPQPATTTASPPSGKRHRLRNDNEPTTPLDCAQLMDSLLFYLRGPLQIPREYAQDEAYVTKVVTSVWRAVVSVAQQKPGRTFELVVRLLELLNVGQLELLYGTIMVNVEPPDTAMKMSLQALYQHVGTLHRKGIASLHGKKGECVAGDGEVAGVGGWGAEGE